MQDLIGLLHDSAVGESFWLDVLVIRCCAAFACSGDMANRNRSALLIIYCNLRKCELEIEKPHLRLSGTRRNAFGRVEPKVAFLVPPIEHLRHNRISPHGSDT